MVLYSELLPDGVSVVVVVVSPIVHEPRDFLGERRGGSMEAMWFCLKCAWGIRQETVGVSCLWPLHLGRKSLVLANLNQVLLSLQEKDLFQLGVEEQALLFESWLVVAFLTCPGQCYKRTEQTLIEICFFLGTLQIIFLLCNVNTHNACLHSSVCISTVKTRLTFKKLASFKRTCLANK